MKIIFPLLLMVAGFIIVALPDTGVRLFSISKEHGPSLQDMMGLILILLPYTWLIRTLWKRRRRMSKYYNTKLFKTGLFLFGLGQGLIIASVANDYKYWWVYGVILLVAVQIVFFTLAFRKTI